MGQFRHPHWQFRGTTTIRADRMMAANMGSDVARSNGDNPGTRGGLKSSVF